MYIYIRDTGSKMALASAVTTFLLDTHFSDFRDSEKEKGVLRSRFGWVSCRRVAWNIL